MDQVLQINKLNVNEKTGKFNYQSFLEEITRNSLITSKDTTPLSIPSHPNYEMSEEKRKPFYSKTSQNKLKSETVGTKAHENCEIINFENKNTKQNETDNVLHQISKRDNINEVEEQFAPFTFKEQSEQPKQFIQTPKGYYRNVNPFMISSARLPETQKILNSFRNEQQLDPNIIDIKNSAASNKGSTTCLICFDKVPDAVFMECGHGGFFNLTRFFLYYVQI